MPELPEVETVRKNLEKVLKGKKILEAHPDVEDRFVFRGPNAALNFKKAVEGATVRAVGRKGKYFWFELNRKPWPVFHLGMTGNIKIRRKHGPFLSAWGGIKLWNEGKSTPGEKVLSYCRLRLTLPGEVEIAFVDPRRFGRIFLTEDLAREARIKKLGGDPLFSILSVTELHASLRRRKAPIKAILFDQKIFAGVGNWIADEVLFQAGIAPQRRGPTLSVAEVARLRAKLRSVILKAVKLDANYDLYPKSWLFHHRWGKVKGAKHASGHPIEFDTVGGRTTAWVKAKQA